MPANLQGILLAIYLRFLLDFCRNSGQLFRIYFQNYLFKFIKNLSVLFGSFYDSYIKSSSDRFCWCSFNNLLRNSWWNSPPQLLLRHFLYQLAEILRIYFFLRSIIAWEIISSTVFLNNLFVDFFDFFGNSKGIWLFLQGFLWSLQRKKSQKKKQRNEVFSILKNLWKFLMEFAAQFLKFLYFWMNFPRKFLKDCLVIFHWNSLRKFRWNSWTSS